MLPLLAYQQVLSHVDGSQTAPPTMITTNDKEVNNPDFSNWVQAEQHAIIVFNASLTEEALAVTVGLATARDMWVALEAAFCNSSVERVQNLLDNLRALKKGDKTVAEFGRMFKSIYDQLCAIGHPVDDMDQLHWFLCGLGASFESFFTTICSKRPIPTFVDLLESTESHEFIKNLHTDSAGSTVAFLARSPAEQTTASQPTLATPFRPRQPPAHYRPNRSPRPYYRETSRGGFGGRSSRLPTCQLCRKTCHYASQCFHLASFAASAQPTDDQLAHAFQAQCHLNSTVPNWTGDTRASTHMLPNNVSLPHSTPTQGSSYQANSSPGMP